jgi:hypothetical protein
LGIHSLDAIHSANEHGDKPGGRGFWQARCDVYPIRGSAGASPSLGQMEASMIRHLIFSTLLITGAAIPVAAQEKQETKPTDFFPLMAWDGAPNDLAVLKEMRECGLTVAGFAPPAALDNCQAAGLKAIVSDPRVGGYDWTKVDSEQAKKQVTELVEQVRNHPAVFGYYLRDEPPANFFPGLATVAAVVKEHHPGVWPYINLFPNYAENWQLGTNGYEEYLNKFIETCKPTVLSYDHYSLYEGGGNGGRYFENLEAMRKAALKHNLPFWNIIQSVGCLNFREASLTDLRWQVYTSLAYGARGIAYFKYFSAPTGNFRQAPIDHFGHKTAAWEAMRQVNLQVAQLANTLLKLKSDRVYHFGDMPQGCVGPDEQSLVKACGGKVVIGDFTHEDGTRYVMIVNKDFNGSIVCGPQFRKQPSKIEHVSQYSGSLGPFVGEDCWLAPGQGVLLKLTP